jgi:hypothetical protein
VARPTKRDLLETLTRPRLTELAAIWELEVRKTAAKGELISAFVRRRGIPVPDLLDELTRDELKAACRAFDLDDGGRAKREIAARILAAGMEAESVPGAVRCWMLDTDYNGMCFHASQVFFPKTAAWNNLQRALRVNFDESLWQHLAGTESEPFPASEKRRIAVKVIDERGNELMAVRELS